MPNIERRTKNLERRRSRRTTAKPSNDGEAAERR